jgi:hypothetical protein
MSLMHISHESRQASKDMLAQESLNYHLKSATGHFAFTQSAENNTLSAVCIAHFH